MFRDIVTALGADLFDSVPDPLLGRTLAGRYEVVGRLGEGGVGVVYRAKQAHLGRFVAIKVLHQDAASSTEWRRRFQREAMALSVLEAVSWWSTLIATNRPRWVWRPR